MAGSVFEKGRLGQISLPAGGGKNKEYSGKMKDKVKVFLLKKPAVSIGVTSALIVLLAGALTLLCLRWAGIFSAFGGAPKLCGIKGAEMGVRICWEASEGAEGYHVYRKSAEEEEFLLLAELPAERRAYVDETVKEGVCYTYTVAAVSQNGTERKNARDEKGLTLTYAQVPVMDELFASSEGITLSWEAAQGAKRYGILRSSEGEEWTLINSVPASELTYSDDTAEAGREYAYSVRCMDEDAQTFTGGGAVGYSLAYAAEPVLSCVEGENEGIKLSWEASEGAAVYRIYRQSGGSDWEEIADVDADTLSFLDGTAKEGQTYGYTVGCMDKARAVCASSFDPKGLCIAYVGTPDLLCLEVVAEGVKVSFSPVAGAAGYRILRREEEGAWESAADLSAEEAQKMAQGESLFYVDTQAQTGLAYTYSVRCTDESFGTYTGGFDEQGQSILPLSMPVLTSAKGTAYGVQIDWEVVDGAEYYGIFRRLSTVSEWDFVGSTGGGADSFTDLDAESGKTYVYTVRCMNEDASVFTSYFDLAGVSLDYVASPTVKGIEGTGNGISVSWGSINGAAGYRIYRKVGNGDFVKLADVSGSVTEYKDTAVSFGTKYGYTLSSLDSSGKEMSGYKEGAAIIYTKAPVLTSVTDTKYGVKVSWEAVSGAERYVIFRRSGGGSWESVGDTDGTAYTDTSAKSGVTYAYTVRCLSADGLYYTGPYDTTGQSITYIGAPKITSITKSDKGLTVKWDGVSGVTRYRLFRKAADGSWEAVADTASTSYTDGEVLPLSLTATYSYAVRGLNEDGTSYVGSWDANGYSYTNGTAMDQKAQNYDSATDYLILVDCTLNKVGIYTGSRGNWTLLYSWDCSTGKASTPTVKGTYTVKNRGLSFSGANYTCWYFTRFYGEYLFHSVLYNKGSKTTILDGRLGQNLSHGCVRLTMEHAKWIYDNIPNNTTVVTY